jgi:hypothetical protein
MKGSDDIHVVWDLGNRTDLCLHRVCFGLGVLIFRRLEVGMCLAVISMSGRGSFERILGVQWLLGYRHAETPGVRPAWGVYTSGRPKTVVTT